MANVSIVLYSALANIAGEKKIQLEASTPLGALQILKGKFGEEFNDRLFDEQGSPKRFINIYVNGRDVRFLNDLETALRDGDTVTLVPAVSGG